MFLTRVRAESDSDSGDRSPWGSFWFESLGSRTAAGQLVTPERAMRLNAVFSCVKVLAESFALLPFMLWQWEGNPPRRKKRPDHWVYRRIAKAPNRFQTPFEWRLMLMGHLALRGNAFCEIVTNGRGEIVELLPLHPDRMQVELLKTGDYRYVYTDQSGKRIPYLRSEIWHLRWMSADGIVGLSPIELARESIGEGLEQQSYSSRFYANDARPAGWIEFDGTFATKEAKKQWRESWQEAQSGKNARKVAVLEKGMKYHELTLSDADTHHVTVRLRNLRDIARIFRVPAHKVGDLEKSTNNNIEHQSIEFWTDTMLPWARLWSDSIDFFMIGPDSEEMLDAEFDIKPMMRGDGKARAERLKSLVLSAILVPNEAREEEGYDPYEGGDKPLRPLNMVSIDENGEAEPLPEGASKAVPGEPSQDRGGDPNAARLRAVLHANALRMARRMGADKAPPADVLAEAMAVDEAAAAHWLAERDPSMSEQATVESLMQLAAVGGAESAASMVRADLAAAVQRQFDRIATRLEAQPPAAPAPAPMPVTVQLNIDRVEQQIGAMADRVTDAFTQQIEGLKDAMPINIQMPAVQAPPVHVHVEAPTVNVEPAAVHVEAPVTVPAPSVTVIQDPRSSGPGQADRPYPTQTIIKKRDAHGRADVIETRPLDD